MGYGNLRNFLVFCAEWEAFASIRCFYTYLWWLKDKPIFDIFLWCISSLCHQPGPARPPACVFLAVPDPFFECPPPSRPDFPVPPSFSRVPLRATPLEDFCFPRANLRKFSPTTNSLFFLFPANICSFLRGGKMLDLTSKCELIMKVRRGRD